MQLIKNKKLVIVGDGSTAEIVYQYFQYDSEYEVVGFSVEKQFRKKDFFYDLPVVDFEDIQNYYSPVQIEIYVAVTFAQFNRLRARLAHEAKVKGYALASYVSSRAFIWSNVKLGEHCFIFENNNVQPFVEIGNNVVLWSGNHIGHHSVISDNCFISSHVVISGFCSIGENSFLGVNATLADGISIGSDNWIGPNTTILKDTASDSIFGATATIASPVSARRFFKVKE